jgi:hypothetical protein
MSTDTPHRPNPRFWNRRLHRWGAVAIGVPFLVVICTGLLLQVKKQVTWVQPPELRTEAREPSVPYELLMERARAVPEVDITSWDDIDKIDVRPGKGMLKLIGKNRWELQMDIATGEVLQVAYRRSDFIETLHDMSWIHGSAKLWLGVPMGLIVLGLWLTGGYMWLVHLKGRRRARHARASHSAHAALLLVLIPAGGTLAAQQVPDTSFRPVVTAPAYPEGRGPRVLIDEAHFNFHRVDGRYGAFAGVLRRDGFRVGAHRGPFTEASLREADILVIANALGDDGPWVLPARPAFTPEEVSVVRRWVEGGGALLLVADHMPFPGSMQAMGRAFGIEWTDGFAMYSPEERGIMTFRRSGGSLVSGAAAGARMRPGAVDSLVAFTGSVFRLTDEGEPVLIVPSGVKDYQPTRAWEFTAGMPAPSAEGMLMGALLQRGGGRVAVFGEAAMFSAQLAGANRAPMGFNHPAAPQNAQFMLNVLHWLAGRR